MSEAIRQAWTAGPTIEAGFDDRERIRAEAYVEFVLLVRDGDTWRIVSTAWRWADGAGPRAPRRAPG